MLPLDGVRVLAVEQYGAGPWGTQYLADIGAEVIKIENPKDGGDMGRAVGPFFIDDDSTNSSASLFFQSINRNKRSLTLDLSSPDGQAVFHDGDHYITEQRIAASWPDGSTRFDGTPDLPQAIAMCRELAIQLDGRDSGLGNPSAMTGRFQMTRPANDIGAIPQERYEIGDVTVGPQSPAIGAEIVGVDISRPLPADVVVAIKQAC